MVWGTPVEVDPNQMDATVVLYTSKWIMAELVRLLHTLSTEEATAIVDGLIEREVAWVWTHGEEESAADRHDLEASEPQSTQRQAE